MLYLSSGNYFLVLLIVMFFVFLYLWNIDVVSEESFIIFMFIIMLWMLFFKVSLLLLIYLKDMYNSFYTKYLNICLLYLLICEIVYMYYTYVYNYNMLLKYMVDMSYNNMLCMLKLSYLNSYFNKMFFLKNNIMFYMINNMYYSNMDSKLMLSVTSNMNVCISNIFYIDMDYN